MCPSCITTTAAIVATAGSGGGILAVCLTKFRKFFAANLPGLIHKTPIHQTKEK
jgi:hypothetical protein